MIKSLITTLLLFISLSAISQSVLSTGKWYRLQIGKNGVYRISYQKLKSLGFSNPGSVRIFGNGSGMLPKENLASYPTDPVECPSIHQNQYIYFYASAPGKWIPDSPNSTFSFQSHLYAEKSSYFITDINTHQASKIEQLSSSSGVADPISTATLLYHYAIPQYNLQQSGSRWFSHKFAFKGSQTVKFKCNSTPISATATISLASRSLESETFEIGSATKKTTATLPPTSDKGPYATTATSSLEFSPKSPNVELEISFQKKSGEGYLEYVTLKTEEPLVYQNSQMEFWLPNPETPLSQIKIKNLTPSHLAIDISDGTPYIYYAADHGSFLARTPGPRRFAVCAPAHAMEPEYIGEVANQNLKGWQNVQYLIVTPVGLKEYAMQIAALHSDINTAVATDEEIYNEFSHGTRDAAAIRNLARYLYEKDHALRYLLLLGDGSVDNLHNSKANTNRLPTYQSENSLNEDGLSSFVSDDFFGQLETGEGHCQGTLDIGVGRLPVNSGEEAAIVVDKIRRYIHNADSTGMSKKVVFVADDENMNLHMNQADMLANSLETNHPELDIRKIYLDSYVQESSAVGDTYPTARRDFVESIENGAMLINYVGHGGMRYFTDEKILTLSDIQNLSNINRLPIMITASCNIGHFDLYDYNADIATQSPAEYMMLNPNGGAIAMLTTTREAQSNENFMLNKNIISLLGGNRRLGDIIREAKLLTNNRNMLNFVLLGDPALKPNIPEYKIEALEINGVPIRDFSDTLHAMQSYTIRCKVSNPEKFERGSAYVIVYDKMRKITTRNNDGEGYFEYLDYGNTILKAKSTLINGEFEFSLLVPKDISYDAGEMKMSLFAQNGNITASGFCNSIFVGGSAQNPPADNDGPKIDVSISGSGSKTLMINLGDPSGINITGLHGIIIEDLNTGATTDITRLAEPVADHPGQFVIRYNMGELGDGLHSIRISAWDNLNNQSHRIYSVTVSDKSKLEILSLRNYPNPFSGHTTIEVSHNASSKVAYTLTIVDMNGRIVGNYSGVLDVGEATIEYGQHQSQGQLHNGIYLYRLSISDTKKRSASKSARMVYQD